MLFRSIYAVDKALKDLGDKADAALVGRINQAKEDLAKALAGEDLQEMRSKKDSLEKALHELSTAAYQRATQAQAGAAPQDTGPTGYGPGGEGGKTVDADYNVVDDDKKT